MCLSSRIGLLVVSIIAFSVPAQGQRYEASEPSGGPFSREVILNAPFSADAITRVRESLSDGSTREYVVTARYYRDSQGRVRAELDSTWGKYVMLWTRDQNTFVFFALDPATRTFQVSGHAAATWVFNGEGVAAVPIGKACFRTTPRVAGDLDIQRLEAVHAKISAQLGLVIASHRSEAFGSVDYKLTNIELTEPSSDLFDVPTDYTNVTGSNDMPLIELDGWKAKNYCIGQLRRPRP